MYQWNFNIQRQLFESTTLTVGYVGSRGLHLYAARDINPVLPTVVNGVQVFGVPQGGATAAGIISNPRLNPAGAALSSEAPVGDSNYQLPAGRPEPALLARSAIPAFLHLVEVPGQRLRHVWAGRRHTLVQSSERIL